jgi:hypothetical protein
VRTKLTAAAAAMVMIVGSIDSLPPLFSIFPE